MSLYRFLPSLIHITHTLIIIQTTMLTECATPFAAHCVGKTLDAGRLELVEVLGEGAYGVVYLAVERLDDTATSSKASAPAKQYAVKVLNRAADWSVVGQCQSREIVTHKIASSHPHVLTLHDVLEDEAALYLVMDYCPGGDLFSAIVERHAFAQNDALLKSVFVQIVDAVQSCHDQGIYHRDLKPDNIFVSADGTQVFLGDFGLATDEAMSKDFRCGSSFYMSPGKSFSFLFESTHAHLPPAECIGEERGFHSYYNEVSDIWSLGVILTNMICGRNPWRTATTNDGRFHQFMSNGGSLRELLPMSQAASDVLKRVFTFNPSERISLAELRTAVLAIDTFFATPGEVATASDDVKAAVAGYKPRTPLVTPELPVKETFESMHDYPDEEYLFASPDPDDWSLYHSASPAASAASTPTSEFSDTSTLFDVVSPGVWSKGKELEAYLVSEDEEDGIAREKRALAPQAGPGARLLARLLA